MEPDCLGAKIWTRLHQRHLSKMSGFSKSALKNNAETGQSLERK